MSNLGRIIRVSTVADFELLVRPALSTPNYNFAVAVPGAVVRFYRDGQNYNKEATKMSMDIALFFLEKNGPPPGEIIEEATAQPQLLQTNPTNPN